MKILVVDDEKLLVKGIRFNLENEGYDVITGADGMEAVESGRQREPRPHCVRPDDAAARRAGGLRKNPRVFRRSENHVNRKGRRHG